MQRLVPRAKGPRPSWGLGARHTWARSVQLKPTKAHAHVRLPVHAQNDLIPGHRLCHSGLVPIRSAALRETPRVYQAEIEKHKTTKRCRTSGGFHSYGCRSVTPDPADSRIHARTALADLEYCIYCLLMMLTANSEFSPALCGLSMPNCLIAC